MSDVIQIPIRRDEIWVCLCGCSSFSLLGDGSIECSSCGTWAEEMGSWYEEKPAAEATDDPPFGDIQGNGSVDFAKAQVIRSVQSVDVVMIMTVAENGRLKLWTSVEGKAQEKWLLRQFSAGKKLFMTVCKNGAR